MTPLTLLADSPGHAFLVPAAKSRIAQFIFTAAVDRCIFINKSFGKSCQSGNNLEGRTWRILSLQRLVLQRVALVFKIGLPLFAAAYVW